jgi:hypothetical protein
MVISVLYVLLRNNRTVHVQIIQPPVSSLSSRTLGTSGCRRTSAPPARRTRRFLRRPPPYWSLWPRGPRPRPPPSPRTTGGGATSGPKITKWCPRAAGSQRGREWYHRSAVANETAGRRTQKVFSSLLTFRPGSRVAGAVRRRVTSLGLARAPREKSSFL